MSKINKNCACFLAQASHDLRQPLQALMIYIDLFDTDNLSCKQKNIWQKIVNTTNNLNCLLGDILDFSKLELSEFKPYKNKVNIHKLLNNIVQEYEMSAYVKNIKFEYNLCKAVIETDGILLERILRNLLNNAFKFTKDKVNLLCKVYDDLLEISIEDNGVGINKDDLPYIFEEFYQGKNTHHINDKCGVGLGLAIVKKITAAIGAKIKVVSAVGSGSIFTLIIKL